MSETPTSALEAIEKRDLKQLLLRGWMTHDGRWLKSAIDEVGVETANRLNLSAIRHMAPLEVRRLRQVLGMDGVRSFDELRRFMTGAMDLVGGDFMAFRWDWSQADVLRVEVDERFAHLGVVRLGAIDRYHCGIYERIYAWIDALGIRYERPAVGPLCTKHREGTCVREIHFSWGEMGG